MDLSTVDEVRYDLRKCTITGPVRLVGARLLRGHVDLSDAVFDHLVDLSEARILARVVCEGTAFRSGGTFTRTRFEGPVWFERATFHSGAVFTEAVFSATASFHATRATYALRFPDAVLSDEPTSPTCTQPCPTLPESPQYSTFRTPCSNNE